jgi:hypothetical protein
MRKTFWAPDSNSANRAKQSQLSGRSDTFTGVGTITERVGLFTGVVWTVEDMGEKAAVGRRWRVSIEVAS